MPESFWDRFFRRKSEAKGLSLSLEPNGFVTEIRDYRRPHYPSADTVDLQDIQTRNELVYACLAIKGGTAQDPRLIVEQGNTRGGKTEYEELPGHPLRQLLMRPNPNMTDADLMRAAIVSWDISNPRRFYAEKEYTRGLLTAIHPLNPSRMRPKYSRERADRIIGYIWADGQERREYALDELLIRSAPTWYDPPPLVAALGSVESDNAQTDYVWSFFENGGVPPGLLKYNMPLNDAKRDEVREKWRSVYGNRAGRQHDIGILDANVDYQEIGSPIDKIHSEVLRSVAESRICMVFGVPPLIVYAYVGLIRATYSNLKEAWAGFWDATASPMYKEWRAFYTWNLLTEFEDERTIRQERVRLQWDMSQVSALQEDVDAIQNRARENFKAGGINRAEYRAIIGQIPNDAADAFYILPPGVQVVPDGGIPMPAPEPLPVEEEEIILDDAPPKGRKGRDSISVQTTERRMEQAVRSYLASEYRKAAQAVRSAA